MAKKTAKIMTDERYTYIQNSGFDFVAYRATKDGEKVIKAFQNYANMRNALGSVDIAVSIERVKINNTYREAVNVFKSDMNVAIAKGANELTEKALFDTRKAACEDTRKKALEELTEAAKAARAGIERATAYKTNITKLGKAIDEKGHTVETLEDITAAYFKAFGISLKADTVKTVAQFLNGADVKRATNKQYAISGNTLVTQRGAYLATLLMNLFADTLEKVHVIDHIVPEYVTYREDGVLIIGEQETTDTTEEAAEA